MPSKTQRRAGVLQQAEEQNACHLRDSQASLAQTAWDESGSLHGTCMIKGDLKTRWSWEGDIPVPSPQKEQQQPGRFMNTECSQIGRAQKPVLF